MQSVLRRRNSHSILLLTLLLAVAVACLAGPSSAAGRGGGGRSFGGGHFGGGHFGGFGRPYHYYGGPSFSLGIGFGIYDYPYYPYDPYDPYYPYYPAYAYPYPVYEYPAPVYAPYVDPLAPQAPASTPAPAPRPSAGRGQSELRVQPAGRDVLRLTWSGDSRTIESATFALLDRKRAELASIDIDVAPFVATLQTFPEATSASATVRYRSGETKTVTLPLRAAPRRPAPAAVRPVPSESPAQQPASTPPGASGTEGEAH